MLAVLVIGSVFALGCGSSERQVIDADGSTTIYPMTSSVGGEFRRKNPTVQLTVGSSGTGGGFSKFVAGQTDINNASRPITDTEIASAEKNGVQFIELPVAYDGLTVIIHPENTWVDKMTVAELHELYKPGSTVTRWSQLREGWPDETITLYGQSENHGTFDYFTEAINGKAKATRTDYTAVEPDMMVLGVSRDKNAIGYLGIAYYVENKDAVKAVPVDGGGGPVTPSEETVMDGTYTPLARPVFIYVNAESAKRPEMQSFIRFYLTESEDIIRRVGYVPLPQRANEMALKHFEDGVTGSLFHRGAGSAVGMTVEQLLERAAESFAP
jgi:phosphate transport system substrate-binding protein